MFFFIPFISPAQLILEFDNSVEVIQDGKKLSMPWAGGLNSGQYNKIDLDGDGVEDMVIYDRTSEKINTFLFKNNQWVFAPEYVSLFPEGVIHWMILVDYNADGLKDLFTSVPAGMMVYKNVSKDNHLLWKKVAEPLYAEGFSRRVNLQLNYMDIPSIADVNGDGAPDILVYNFSTGHTLDYYKNMSLEYFKHQDSLEFKRITRVWGEFNECGCHNFAFEGAECEGGLHRLAPLDAEKLNHVAGRSFLVLDMDDNGLKDLVMGMEECEELFFLDNEGSKENAVFKSYSSSFPNEADPVMLNTFPAPFFADIDGDDIKDLIVAPNVSRNITRQIDFINSSWYYKNTGTNQKPVFEFKSKSFLQDEMIDAGENAALAFFDLDGDGDQDLFITHAGRPNEKGFASSVWYYENTGTPEQPSFSLKTKDFLNLSDFQLASASIHFADLNGDGKNDFVIAASDEFPQFKQFYYILHKSSATITMPFERSRMQEIPFQINQQDMPLFYDVDKDGKVDLLVGKVSGRLDYYKHTGSTASPDFTLEESGYLGIQDNFQKRNPSLAIGDLNGDKKADLVITDQTGQIYLYSDFSNNREGEPEALVIENKVTSNKETARIGYKNSVFLVDLFQNGKPAIVVGSAQGGLFFLRQTEESQTSNPGEKASLFKIYPNPGSGEMKIDAYEDIWIDVISIHGQQMMTPQKQTKGLGIPMDLGILEGGYYIIRAWNDKSKDHFKLIIKK